MHSNPREERRGRCWGIETASLTLEHEMQQKKDREMHAGSVQENPQSKVRGDQEQEDQLLVELPVRAPVPPFRR